MKNIDKWTVFLFKPIPTRKIVRHDSGLAFLAADHVLETSRFCGNLSLTPRISFSGGGDVQPSYLFKKKSKERQHVSKGKLFP